MPTKESMEGLTQLFERIDHTRYCLVGSEDENRDKFLELVDYIHELTLHVKQLQIEVAGLCQRTTSLT